MPVFQAAPPRRSHGFPSAAPSNTVLEAEGYGEYCHPAAHQEAWPRAGLLVRSGRATSALDNNTVLTEGMVFMIHPNQHLPETGYLLCGEPVLVTARRGPNR